MSLHCANNADLCTGWDSASEIAKAALVKYASPKKRGGVVDFLTTDNVSHCDITLL